MGAIMDASAWATIGCAVVGVFVAAIGALLAVVFAGVREDIKANTDAITQNAGDVRRAVGALSSLLWRVTTAERFLAEHFGYRPPWVPPGDPTEGGTDVDVRH